MTVSDNTLPLRLRVAGTLIVLRRELGATFGSAVAYVYTVAAILLVNSLFMNEFFLTGRLSMRPFFDALPWLSVLLLPAISMRLWSEERKQRTFELWMTLPLAPSQVVLGKFLAALGLYLVFLAGTLPIPILLEVLGDPDRGLIVSGYGGAVLLGALFLAVGGLLSALSRDQITAFIASVLAGFLFVATGHERVIAVLDGLAPRQGLGTRIADHVSALPRYEDLVRGLIELSDLLWFLGVTGVFLAATTWVVTRFRA